MQSGKEKTYREHMFSDKKMSETNVIITNNQYTHSIMAVLLTGAIAKSLKIGGNKNVKCRI